MLPLIADIRFNPSWTFGDLMQVIATVGVALAALAGIGLWTVRRILVWRLFVTFEEPDLRVDRPWIMTWTSNGSQEVKLTIRLALRTYVEFVSLRFEGSANRPKITGLDDWQHRPDGRAPGIATYDLPDGKWYWQYMPTLHRRRNSRITIRILYEATQAFDGALVVALTTSDGAKDRRITFHAVTQS